MVAIFLLALLILAVFNLFPTMVLANRQGSERLQALTVAQSTLAELRSRPFDELTVGLSEVLPAQSLEGIDYLSEFRILAPEEGDPARLRVLEVTVTWEKQKVKRTLTEKLWIHRRIEERV